MESPIPKGKNGPMRGIVCRVRMIDGYLYVCDNGRSVCRRRGVNDWASFCFDLPVPTLKEYDDVNLNEAMTFLDIDGFNEADMYVVGGQGVVWHLKEKSWRQIDFPGNMYLESVCCAGDGCGALTITACGRWTTIPWFRPILLRNLCLCRQFIRR